MKLPIKKKYFDEIKTGKKDVEFRDAHITFVCEETGETLKKDIKNVSMIKKAQLSTELYTSGMFDDESIICFRFK